MLPSLMLRTWRRTGSRFAGNIRLRTGGGCSFLSRFSLSAFSCTRLGRHSGAGLSGNTRFRSSGSRRFLSRVSLSAFSCTRLGRHSGAGLSGNTRFRSSGSRRFLGRVSLSAFSCTRLIRSAGLFHRAGLLRGRRLGLRHALDVHFWRFWFGLLGLFSPLLLPCSWCRLFLRLLRKSSSSQRQRTAY